MVLKQFVSAVLIAGVAAAPLSAMAAPGTSTISAVKGGAYVWRNGTLAPARPNMRLNAGDRVVTRPGGSATLASGGCTTVLGTSEMTTASSGCDKSIATFSRAGYDSHSSALFGAGGGVIIAAVAAAAVIAGIVVIASDNDNDNNNSVSP